MISVIKDVDLIEHVDKYDVILVGTNTYHVMGNGFQRKVRVNYPDTYTLNMRTKYGDINKLGMVVCTSGKPVFALCFITHGYNFRPDKNPDYLDYGALESCIKYVNKTQAGLNIATTMVGCSKFDGNGNKERVFDILSKNSDNINLFIYDYEQISRNIESVINYANIIQNEVYDRETKNRLINDIIENSRKQSTLTNPKKRMDGIKANVKAMLKK